MFVVGIKFELFKRADICKLGFELDASFRFMIKELEKEQPKLNKMRRQ